MPPRVPTFDELIAAAEEAEREAERCADLARRLRAAAEPLRGLPTETSGRPDDPHAKPLPNMLISPNASSKDETLARRGRAIARAARDARLADKSLNPWQAAFFAWLGDRSVEDWCATTTVRNPEDRQPPKRSRVVYYLSRKAPDELPGWFAKGVEDESRPSPRKPPAVPASLWPKSGK